MQRLAARSDSEQWDMRIYPGLRVMEVPAEARETLAQALGVVGVEAEYFLALVKAFTARLPDRPHTRQEGELFLWQLESSGRRLVEAAGSIELAAQAYLGALESVHPEVRGRERKSAAHNREEQVSEPWWPAPNDSPELEESLELRLRRCGYAYRHVVAARLSANVEAIAEQLALVLHALRTLPPAGVLPATSLYDGLDELAAVLQGHLVPHHLNDVSDDMPGLLSGIGILRRLDAAQDRSLDADLTWARSQLAEVERMEAALTGAPAPQATSGAGGGKPLFAGLFRRAQPQPGRASSAPGGPPAWIRVARGEWQETIAQLESLRAAIAQGGAFLRKG